MDRWKEISKYVGLCVGVALLIVFFRWGEQGMMRHQAMKTGPVEFESIPNWVTQDLRMELVTLVGGAEFVLREGIAQQLGQALERSAWLDQVRVQALSDCILVKAQWRKPVARVMVGDSSYYLDAQAVALEALDLPTLPIVTFKHAQDATNVPWGTVVQSEDILAGLALVQAVTEMDRVMAQKARQSGQEVKSSLLFELQALDLSNFNGRANKNKPHLVFQSKEGTTVVWGAELGAWGASLGGSGRCETGSPVYLLSS